LSATGRPTFPAPLITASKRLILYAIHWSKTQGPRFKAKWNSGERCAACRHVIRSEWSKTRAVRLSRVPAHAERLQYDFQPWNQEILSRYRRRIAQHYS
jgi:hypothetical protein